MQCNMKCKDFVGSIIAFAVIVGVVFFMCWAAITGTIQLRAHKQFINQSIGKTVVIEKDTLLIVNYQQGGFGNTQGFILSNGVFIDDEIVRAYEIY